MYKRITHTIVEEHFDSVKDAKAAWKAPLRFYSDGVQIPSNLPESYSMATGEQRCQNCAYYQTVTGSVTGPDTPVCTKWQAVIRPEYYCAAWTAPTPT
jgi:hypothetical protein